MNIQCEHNLCKFEMDHNTKQPKDIYCVKGEITVDHRTVTRSFKKFCLGWKNLDNQARSDRPKAMDSEAVLQARGKSYDEH